jgi:hypothetical protein
LALNSCCYSIRYITVTIHVSGFYRVRSAVIQRSLVPPAGDAANPKTADTILRRHKSRRHCIQTATDAVPRRNESPDRGRIAILPAYSVEISISNYPSVRSCSNNNNNNNNNNNFHCTDYKKVTFSKQRHYNGLSFLTRDRANQSGRHLRSAATMSSALRRASRG